MVVARLARLGLAPRLAALIGLILLTTVVVDSASRAVIPMADIIFMDQQWLAGAVASARSTMEDLPPRQRPAALTELPSATMLDFEIREHSRGTPSNEMPQKVLSLKESLQAALPAGTEVVVTVKEFPFDESRSLNSIAVVIKEIPMRMVDVLEHSDKGSVIASPELLIEVSLSNGTWLSARQAQDGSLFLRLLRNFAAPVFGIAIILLISFRASRALLTPLQQLSAAAERLGRERSITAIPEMKVPEYKAIADSFNQMQTRLKRFVDERTQMLAAISHDLNTPLTRLRLLAEDLSDGRQREQVLSDIDEMEMMVQSVLAFARDDSHQEPSVSVDIASLLISLCDIVSDAGQTARYRGPDHAFLPCRPGALRRAVGNLIDNGCKYGGQVVVELAVIEEAVEIRIADRGPGIAEEDREKAFMPFQRLETSRNRQTGGTGLGLSIARDIIRGHGGEIVLQNGPEGGLIVLVRLPRPAQAALRRTG